MQRADAVWHIGWSKLTATSVFVHAYVQLYAKDFAFK